MNLAGLRVLVVEDEAPLAMMIEDYLEDLGCKVVASAARVADALMKAATLTLDVAILDVNLNGELSYPVAEALQARGVPFVFATGYDAKALPAMLCAIPVLCKPFPMKAFANALCAASGRR